MESDVALAWPYYAWKIPPYNYGERVYTGEGAYTGLTYRYLVAGNNNDLVIAGRIEPEESSE